MRVAIPKKKPPLHVVLPKDFAPAKKPPLHVALPKNFAPVKGAGDAPDIGDTDIEEYSELERAVQAAEGVDGARSNAAFLAEMGARVAPTGSSTSAALRSAGNVLGKGATAAQVALWAVDGARGVASPEYREETGEALDARLRADGSTLGKSLSVGLQAAARPVSVGGAMIRDFQNSQQTIKDAEKQGAMWDRKIAQRKEEVEEERRKKHHEAEIKKVSKHLESLGVAMTAPTPTVEKLSDTHHSAFFTGGPRKYFR